MKLDDATAKSEISGRPQAATHFPFGRDITAKSFHRALVFLGLLGLVIRIGFFVEHGHNPSFGVPTLDERYYDTVARMLLSGEDLRELHGFRPLLYPIFLAACYQVGGVGLAILVQHLMGVATGLLVAILGARIFQNRIAGLLGGLLYLLAPVPLAFEGELLIEPSYIFLIVCGLWLHVQAVKMEGWRSGAFWLAGGAMMVLAAQERANILVFLAFYPVFAVWHFWRARKANALRPLLGLVGAFCLMLPWAILNMRQTDHFHLLPGGGGVNLYLGNRRGADGMLVGEDVIKSLSKLSLGTNAPFSGRRVDSGGHYQDLVEVWAAEEYAADLRKHGEEPSTDPMAISSYWTRRALAEIKADPGAWLRLIGKKCWLMLWNAEIPNNKDFRFLQKEYGWLRVLPIRWVVLMMLAPLGIWAAFNVSKNQPLIRPAANVAPSDGARGTMSASVKSFARSEGERAGVSGGSVYARNVLLIILFYLAAYSAGNVAFFICDRYRYPVWPAMAILAGGGWLGAYEIFRRHSPRPVAYVSLSMIVMMGISVLPWFNVSLPSFAQDYYFRSLAEYDKGLLPDALADVDRSIALYKFDAGPQHHRGNILFAMNRLPEARTAYEQTLKLVPGDSGVWNNLGATLDALGETDAALDAFRHATESGLPSENAFTGLAAIQIRTGQLDDAALTLLHLHELKPTPNATELALRSVIARRKGDAAQADTLEKQARALDSGAVDWTFKQVRVSR